MSRPSIGSLAAAACLLEVAAPKPGNVYPGREFGRLRVLDFQLAAAAIAPILDRAAGHPLGGTILEAVRESRRVTEHNANLGIVLLLAPLAAVPDGEDLRAGVRRVLRSLTADDARDVYEAIRLAAPQGLGDAPEHDVRDAPPEDLLDAMRLARHRDHIAKQYADDFVDVFDSALPVFERTAERSGRLLERIVLLHLELLVRHPDTHIARRAGAACALEAARRAQAVLDARWPASGAREIESFDDWLRQDGNIRNPGTTADLVAATLFLALRAGIIRLPLSAPL